MDSRIQMDEMNVSLNDQQETRKNKNKVRKETAMKEKTTVDM